MTTEADELPGTYAIELHFSSTEEGTEDTLGDSKVIWKDILREGTIAITPGRKKKVPFKVIPKGQSDPQSNVISMADLIESYDNKAFEDVTIPDGHPKPGDSALNNTGYVRGLRILKKKGKHYLQGALGFTEPDVASKVRRGTVPNVSSGIFLGFTRKADDTYFPAALNHVALTKSPWINDLEPFKKVFAADSEDDFEMHVAEFDDETGEEAGSSSENKGDIIWNEQDGSNWIRESLSRALEPDAPSSGDLPQMPRPWYSVVDVAQKKNLALVDEYYKGDRTRIVMPFDIKDGGVEPGPRMRWTEGKEALIAASEEIVGSTDNFGDLSVGRVTEKLGLALSDMFGEEEGKTFTVEEIALDQRALIRDKNDRVYLADFVLFSDRAMLAPTDEWEQKSAPSQADAKRPASAPKSATQEQKVVQLHDPNTPDGRVQAARQARRQLIASSH